MRDAAGSRAIASAINRFPTFALCHRLPPFAAPKGQEKGNVVLCPTPLRVPLEPSRQSLRGLIQPIIETGKPCVAKAGASRHFDERRQMDAIEAAQPVS